MSSAAPGALHLCFVSSNIYPVLAGSSVLFAGGAEVQQVMIARALRARGYCVSVLTKDWGAPDRVMPDGIRVHHTPPVGQRGVPGLRSIHPRLTDLVAALHRIDPDVVYFRCAGGQLAAGAWYARSAGKRLVYAAAHDDDFKPGRIFGLERRELLLYRAALRCCDHVLVQNRSQQALLRSRFGQQGELLPNCYTEVGIAPGQADGPVVWVGTVKPAKRPEVFIELAARWPQQRFVMVGGPAGDRPPARAYYDGIEARARTLSNLEFVGFVPFSRVGERYDGASVLVNTSETEGFPNTFLQAWIRGIPTLSFVAPTTDDEPTATIACGDADAMSAALGSLIVDAAAWARASAYVRSHFERCHSVDAVLPRYEELLSAPRSKARVGLGFRSKAT